MLKRIVILVLFLVIFVTMLVFTKLNSGLIEIDLAFRTVASSIPLAFTVTFVMGLLFGLLFGLRSSGDASAFSFICRSEIQWRIMVMTLVLSSLGRNR